MALAPFDLFTTVIPARVCYGFFSGFNRLAVDHGGTRFGIPTGLPPHPFSQGRIELFPTPVLGPLPKVIVDGLPRGQIVRHQAPLDPAIHDVKDGVQNFS
jgi:hypothetical protein